MVRQDGGSEVAIRASRPGDAERAVAITAEVFGPVSLDAMIEQMLGRAGVSWQEIKADAVRKEFAANPAGCFLAEIGGEAAGYITTAIHVAAKRGLIPNLAVARGAQGKGVGRKLLLAALDYFRRQGLRQAKIETLACNEVGQHLYPAVGFREVARQIHYVLSL
ncbi:MAG TPA: GNAT family N-acetyltransferase [Phycisphaerae bacterium]|nr:GNAT family N-acetyltransferase [Phycisphaerae bacterium]